MKKAILVAAFVAFGAGCAGDNKRAMSGGKVKDIWEQVSDEGFIRVRGVGAAPLNIKEDTRRKGMSLNAARVAARYELLQVIKGLKLEGGLTVGELIQTKGEIKEVADRIVAGAEEAQVEWAKDEGCVVLLQLDRTRVDEILSKTAAYEVKN